MASDPYGIDLLLTPDGDLAVTPAGQLATIDGPLNCAQAMVMRLRTHPGELALRPEFGNALERTVIGTKTNDPTLLVSAANAELRQILQQDRRFLSATTRATVDPADPTRTAIRVDLKLAGGDRLVSDDLGAAALDSFQVQPDLADTLTSDQLANALGADPDAALDEVPDLDEFLEGSDGVTTFDQSAAA